MAGYSITTLTNDLIGVTHGTTVDKIPNLFGIFNRAARQVLLDVDPKETIRIVSLSPVFNGVYDYAAPPDVKGDRMIDVRPQAGRTGEMFSQTYGETFDVSKGFTYDNTFYTQWNTGVKSLRINAPFLTTPVTLSDTGSTTGWSATTGASSITLDQTNNVAGGGALTFNLLAGSATGYVETSSLSQVNLTGYVNNSNGFMWVYLPSASAITNIIVRWGSDSSNYYTYTITTTQQGTAFQTGWNLVTIPWASATVTGSPVTTAYDYVRVTFTYNSTLQTGVKICNLVFAQGTYFEAVYYSKFLFRDPVTNVFQETVVDATTDSAKLINLDTESYNLYFNKCAYYVAQQLQGSDAAYDAVFWDNEYNENLKRYKAQNPSEAILKGEPYYQIKKKGYNRFNPGYWTR